MAFSLSLGKWFGIGIELHWTFLLLFALVVLLTGIDGAIIITVLFGSVLLHELCHSIVARAHRIGIQKIILLPIGGMSVVKQMSTNPYTEFRVAIAGPLFNFAVVVATLYLQLFILRDPWWSLLELVKQANLVLGAFNLFLPALPMDGGRILRALLAMRYGYMRATALAVKVSQIISIGIIFGSITLAVFYGIWSTAIWISLIAFIVYIAAQSEYTMAVIQATLHGMSVRDAMVPAVTLSPKATLQDAYDEFQLSRRPALPLNTKQPLVVDARDLTKLAPREWVRTPIAKIARVVPAARPQERLFGALNDMLAADALLSPVYDRGKLVGALYKEDVEFQIRMRRVRGEAI